MSLKSSTKVETNKFEVIVTISAEDFEAGINKAYNKNKGKIALKGFRKGKAPRAMIERAYGEEVFFEDAVDMLYPEELAKAIDEAKLEVIAVTNLEVTSMTKADGVEFKATCVVKPEVEIDGYSGIKVTRDVKTVGDEEVTAEIAAMQQRGARLIVAEEGKELAVGDTAVFDFEGFKDGEAFEGGKAENFELEIGSNQFIPGFEDKMIGHKAGEEFDIDVTFPEEYQEKSLAGQPAVFKIKLHEIKYKELPELDDEFAKDMSEFDTLDELKADIKAKKQEAAEKDADAAVENQLFDKLTELLEGEIPDEMYEKEVDHIVEDMAHQLSHQGLSLEMYLGWMGMDVAKDREMSKERAVKQVKLRLALEKIAEKEGFEVTEKDLDEEYATIAEQYQIDVEQVKAVILAEDLSKDIKVRKAVEFVKENAKVTKAAAKKTTAKKTTAKAEDKAEGEEKAPAKKTTTKKTTTKKAADTEEKPAAKKTTTTKKTTTKKTTTAKSDSDKGE